MREAADRFHMLEQLADHDDVLLEQLLEDKAPSQETVLADLASETASNLVVPVLFGSATTGFGIRRLVKMLRHDTPHPDRAAARLGANGASAYVFRVSNGNAMGRIAYARVFGGGMNERSEEGAVGNVCVSRVSSRGSQYH